MFNIVKMSILPICEYRFNEIPNQIPENFCVIGKVIWTEKRTRIALKKWKKRKEITYPTSRFVT